DFMQTMSLVEAVRFTSSFTFLYSPRTGTKAATMENQIAQNIKKERLYALNKLQERIIKEDSPKFVGQTLRAMVESTTAVAGQLKAKAENTKTIICEGDSRLVGRVVKVMVRDVKQGVLLGDIIEEE
ncbi:TRAM domain-containing protein, partial [Clostridia bacterium OttesenSCG-928-F22]|nr:TRAM domain-containing protein [Clostridia bacterium OttesenSCG-928-F22]